MKDEIAKENPSASVTPDSIQAAVEEYQHAEIIVQTRLNNFLTADSILILSWVAVFASDQKLGGHWVLVGLSLLSTLLATFWTILGMRQKKFLALHDAIIFGLEQQSPKFWRLHDPIRQLQTGKKVTAKAGIRQIEIKLNWAEIMLGERNLGILAPLTIAIILGALMIISITT